jgi:hypothetical protein
MTRAHFVKKAQKDYPEFGIKKGDSYWHWAFAFGPKYKSKTQPTRSQLTRSNFLSTLYSIEDGISNAFKECTTSDDLESSMEQLISDIEELRDETQNSLDNMPSQLQDADSGQLLQERIEALESWISDLQSIDLSIEDDLSDEEKANRIQEIIEEIEGYGIGL